MVLYCENHYQIINKDIIYHTNYYSTLVLNDVNEYTRKKLHYIKGVIAIQIFVFAY